MPFEVQSFIVNIQCSNLLNIHLPNLVHHRTSAIVKLNNSNLIASCGSGVAQPIENKNACALIATSQISLVKCEKDSQLVFCVSKTPSSLDNEINEIQTEEATQEENLTLSESCT